MPKNNTDPQATPPTDDNAMLEALKAKIEEKKQAIESAKTKAEDDFYGVEHERLPETVLALKFSDAPEDKKAFMQGHSEARSAFVNETVQPMTLELAAIEEEYENALKDMSAKEQQTLIENAKKEFLEKNPDVDFAKLSEFFNFDITPRERQKLDEGNKPHLEFMQGVLDLFNANKDRMNGAAIDKQEQKEELEEQSAISDKPSMPPQFANTMPANPNTQETDEEYLERIGLRK